MSYSRLDLGRLRAKRAASQGRSRSERNVTFRPNKRRSRARLHR
jgi:hypothetical protein